MLAWEKEPSACAYEMQVRAKPWWYLNDRAARVRAPPVPTSNSLLERHPIVTPLP
jgi:hypothetical protein